ncbi:MAG: NAD(P)-dependent oxidoreductase [Pseudomonas sp.]|nr:NAD(P)-dependent oxidoreductase [Pseudomonas sp.]
MNIYITGVNGFIGGHLARHISETMPEDRIVGLGHASRDCDSPTPCFVQGEIEQPFLDRAAENWGPPDIVYHLAGGSSVGASLAAPLKDFHRSAGSTSEVCEWVRVNCPDTAIVFSSSAAVYGASDQQICTEEDRTIPFSPYGFNKSIAELILENYSRTYGLKTISVRLFSIYGEGLRKQLIWDLCNKLLENKSGHVELDGTGNEVRDWLYAADACRILSRAAPIASLRSGILNAGRGVPVSVKEFVEQVIKAWGFEPDVVFTNNVRPGDPECLVASTDSLVELNLDHFTPLEKGIKKYVDWFKELKDVA